MKLIQIILNGLQHMHLSVLLDSVIISMSTTRGYLVMLGIQQEKMASRKKQGERSLIVFFTKNYQK